MAATRAQRKAEHRRQAAGSPVLPRSLAQHPAGGALMYMATHADQPLHVALYLASDGTVYLLDEPEDQEWGQRFSTAVEAEILDALVGRSQVVEIRLTERF